MHITDTLVAPTLHSPLLGPRLSE